MSELQSSLRERVRYLEEKIREVSEPFTANSWGDPSQCDFCDHRWHENGKHIGNAYANPDCHHEDCVWLSLQEKK